MTHADTDLAVAGPGDLSEIEALVQDAYAPYVARIGMKPGPMRDDYAAHVRAGRLRVLRADGRIAGILVLEPQDEALLLDNVAVAPWAQGRGYGRRLLDAAEQVARGQRYERIRLYTHVKMTENIAIYAGRGYRETGRTEVNGLHRVYMEKALA